MMDQASVERAAGRFRLPEGAMERLVLRRDRKRRNRRIRAGAAGIALFVAAIWVVTSAGTLGRTHPPVVPGEHTGTAADPFWLGFAGLPPEGAQPSEPSRGELLMSRTGNEPWYVVQVYADGRMIWARQLADGSMVSGWIEQRLTPEGVELLRTGAVELGGQYENPGQGLPASAWEDPELRPYVPSTYALGGWEGGWNSQDQRDELERVDPARVRDMLPEPALDRLGGAEPVDGPGVEPARLEVTLQDARAIAAILIDEGFEQTSRGDTFLGVVSYTKDHFGPSPVWVIELHPVLPDGEAFINP
jgi:hypothetical protein